MLRLRTTQMPIRIRETTSTITVTRTRNKNKTRQQNKIRKKTNKTKQKKGRKNKKKTSDDRYHSQKRGRKKKEKKKIQKRWHRYPYGLTRARKWQKKYIYLYKKKKEKRWHPPPCVSHFYVCVWWHVHIYGDKELGYFTSTLLVFTASKASPTGYRLFSLSLLQRETTKLAKW